jgi:signal transduction histidine kinase
MKPKATTFSPRYTTALQKHLKQEPGVSLVAALKLGREAVTAGVDASGIARIYEQALVTLLPAGPKGAELKQATRFFTEAIAPIVETYRAAQDSRLELKQLTAKLSRRTGELAISTRKLKRGVIRHKAMEEALHKSASDHKKCLQESLPLQKRLRQLTHRVLAAQEKERKSISLELQDEIAQTLLGINVRLLSLRQDARNQSAGFKENIASTQRLVTRSVETVKRVVREIGSKRSRS